MGKIKTHKASAKRFDVTASGKVKANHAQHRHKLGLKTAKRKRHLRKGTILSRDLIINKIWGWNFDGDNRTVDTHIKRIRKALGDKAHLIVTTTGIGYSFKKEE